MALIPDEKICHTRVVRMQMGNQHIPAFRVRVQFPQSLLQGGAAFLIAKACIDQQIVACSANKIAVQFPQRVIGKGHADPIYICCNFFYHGSLRTG